ncbi:MAG: chromosome partitioning protein ParB [Euryarchaeota archaeon]|nr:chromosome partitioning protein ParB [Euryarchaeota archaeon]|tara:strand:+ start:33407 stop:34264 length:858 start_codon:yes stop_codon:yes gene_type:complete
MTDKKSGLGRGLDSLLGERPKGQDGGVSLIAIEDLSPGQFQPRKKMHRSTLEELSISIKEQGIIQPLVARRQASGRYEIVVGERRWRAAQMAGLKDVPVIIKNLDNHETAKIALIENLQREDLNALDQARGLQRLQKEFNLSQEALASSVGKSRSTVTNTLRLLNLEQEVQKLLEDSKIDMGHARALLTLDGKKQIDLALLIVKRGLSVRAAERLVSGEKGRNKTPKRKRRAGDPNVSRLENQLSETLGATVSIQHNKKGSGKVVINFDSLESLEGILEKIHTET